MLGLDQILIDRLRARAGAPHPIDGLKGFGGCILLLVGLLASVLVISVISYALQGLWTIFSVIRHNAPNKQVAGLICSAAALSVGGLLYELRKRQRGIYALIEIAFGLASASLVIAELSPQDELDVWLAFAGAAYLVVRGFDNIDVAKQEGVWPWQKRQYGSAQPDASSGQPASPSAR